MRLGLSRRLRPSATSLVDAATPDEAAVLDWMSHVMANVDRANTMLSTSGRREEPEPPESVVEHQVD